MFKIYRLLFTFLIFVSLLLSSCQKPNPVMFKPFIVNIEKIMSWGVSSDGSRIQHPSFIQGDITFFDEYIVNPAKDKPEFTRQYLRKQLVAKSLPSGKVIWKSPDRFNNVVIPYDSISKNFFFAIAFAEKQVILPTIRNELVNLSLPAFQAKWIYQPEKPIRDLLGCNQTQVLFTNSDNELVALNLITAKVDWQLQLNQSITQFQVIDSQRIILVTDDQHELWMVNTRTGTGEWIHKSQDSILHRSLVIKDSKLFFLLEKSTTDTVSTLIQAFDIQTKKILWSKEIKGSHRSKLSDEKISFYRDTLFLPFLVDGKPIQLWLKDGKDVTSRKIKKHFASNNKKQFGYGRIFCDVRDDYLFLINTYSGGIFCYDLRNQSFKWHLSCHQIVYGPVLIRDQFLFVCDRSNFKKQGNFSQYFLIELDTGNIIWKEERELIAPENDLFFFDSPHWNDIVFPDRKQVWNLSPIIEDCREMKKNRMKYRMRDISYHRIAGFILMLSFLVSCSSEKTQTLTKPPNNSSSWMALLPGRLLYITPAEESNQYRGLYAQSITAKSVDSPNTRFGEIRFDISGRGQYQIIGEGKTDWSIEDGNLLIQPFQSHHTISLSHWTESSGTLILDSLPANNQIRLSKLTASPSGVPCFVPIRSFASELSQRPDMAVIVADESHDDSVWIAHWMNDDHVELKGKLKITDSEEPAITYQSNPEFLSSEDTSRLANYRPEGADICWVVTTKDKAHYLFGNVKKNFGGKAVLKRYVKNPDKPENYEEEWVIEGGVDRSFPFIAKCTEDWTLLWSHRWEASKFLFRDLFLEEVTMVEDGFYLSGTLTFRTGFWVGKTDFNGKVTYIRQYHYSDREYMTISRMIYTDQDQLLLTGFMESPPWAGSIEETYQNSWENSEKNQNSFIFITLDQQGQLMTTNQYIFKGASKGIAQLGNAIPLKDGSYLYSGIVQDSFFLMKTDPSGKPPNKLFEMKTLSFQSSESSVNSYPLSVILEKDQLTEKPLFLTQTILNRSVEKKKWEKKASSQTNNLPIVKSFTRSAWITEQAIPYGQAFE